MKTTFATLIVALCVVSQASAQVASESSGGPVVVPLTDHNHGWYAGAWYGGTVAGSVLQGQAALARGLGENAYLRSLAAINRQEAYSRSLDNEVKYARTYFEKRQLRDEYVAEMRGPGRTPEQWQAIQAARTPMRPTTWQLEPASGAIDWPAALMGDRLAEERTAMEGLFAQRAQFGGGLESPLFGQIQYVAQAMQEQLAESVHNMPTTEFIAAKKFIDSLAFEARFPPATDGIALTTR